MTSGRTERTPEKEQEFLEALAKTANVSRSAELCGLGRSTVYEWREGSPEFAAQWDAAIELGTDALEDEAVRRAHEGTLKPVYQGKELVGHIREYSDTLMIFMLKARRPDKFKERIANEHTGKDGGAIQHEVLKPRELLASRITGIATRIGAEGSTGKPH